MAVQKVDGLFTQSGKSASDLRDKEFYFAKRNASGEFALAGDGDAIVGVISEGRNTGYYSSVNTRGNPILKAIAGSAITRGDAVQADAAGTAKTGSTNSIGTAINTVAAGEYVEIDTDAT
jgi:hypothetical protein